MKIILASGAELTPIMVTGETRFVQNANRDTLTFVFDDTYGMDWLDQHFTESTCESINIIGDDGSEAIHNGYAIRAELIKKKEVVEPATSETDEVVVNRIYVSMSQRTYAETQLASLTETVDVLVLENLMA